ncbi:P-loop containing nucleoside triphosphate hydrolase protein [Scleroderma citrinum]
MVSINTRVVLIGVGGATCSGKTTLAKHLCKILPNSVIVHQDDFAPPQELIPIHPILNVQDWDSPEGAIDWPRFRQVLTNVKQDGQIPPGHISHDPLNEQREFPIDAECFAKWRAQFEEVERQARENHGLEIIWVLVDGFLLYWDHESMDELDVRIFLRVCHDTLMERRRERDYYIADGCVWRDPPHYWEQIVWPGYISAHKDMFEGGDVESGKPTGDRVRGMLVFENEKMTTTELVDQCCKEIARVPVLETLNPQ